MPLNLNVVWRVKERHDGDLGIHKPVKRFWMLGVADDQPMSAENEDVVPASCCSGFDVGNGIGRRCRNVGEIRHDRIRFTGFEAGDFQLQPNSGEGDLELLQFYGQYVKIPAGLLRQLIVCERIGTYFGFAEVRHPDNGDLL